MAKTSAAGFDHLRVTEDRRGDVELTPKHEHPACLPIDAWIEYKAPIGDAPAVRVEENISGVEVTVDQLKLVCPCDYSGYPQHSGSERLPRQWAEIETLLEVPVS